ncbi:3-oxo-tetronate kinase [Chelativorans sp.]|uniref:3-oxo-tetronate kinase n=1 Tax=Chelativorans sp. TaxID=2203393 RepID=UPI0028125950|nr:3-oxo-tetronate kinase [Chelativorans sp.]
MLLGCIGDDFTGSSDLANTLAKGGMRTVQYTRIPTERALPGAQAAVISLKSRTCPPPEAVAMSLAALQWLQEQGCRQFFFKYCSTFDSTPDGNIGPVVEALADRLGVDRTIICPAFPATGRTLYHGHLFVGDRLLSESGMERHPLTPMTDSDIRRWLARQSRSGVGHIDHSIVSQGAEAIEAALEAQARKGRRLIVVDALQDSHLMAIGAASRNLRLVTGGSGAALGLPMNFRRAGLLGEGGSRAWAGTPGPAAVLSGSCSTATRKQIASHKAACQPTFAISVDQIMAGSLEAQHLASWFARHQDAVPLAYSSAEPDAVAEVQARYGREAAASKLEAFFADTAKHLVAQGIRRLVVAGGETSGAVVGAIAGETLEIGPEIDPGVPILKVSGATLSLALKSGNFGSDDFFIKAAEMMAG